MVQKNREYRNMPLMTGVEDNDKMIVRGYATTFDTPYTLYEDENYRIVEIIDARAFDNTDMSDVIFQYDHEGAVMARTRNNTLSLLPDNTGLLTEATLCGTQQGRNLFEAIGGGFVDRMSFGFSVADDTWTDTKEDGILVSTRRIMSIKKLYDVSAVGIPANDATSISVRALTDGVIERAKAERLEVQKIEELRKKLQIKLKLGGY